MDGFNVPITHDNDGIPTSYMYMNYKALYPSINTDSNIRPENIINIESNQITFLTNNKTTTISFEYTN